jgi:hypothetical protein
MPNLANRFAGGTPLTLRHNLAGIEDKYIRDAIQEIHDFLHSHDILRGVFRKVTFTAPEAGTFTIEHGLPFVPCEIWVTSALGGAAVTINYDSISEESFEITTDQAGAVKFIAGNITDFDVTR